MKAPKIILSRPKLVLDIKCPKCKFFDIVGTPKIETSCRNCKTLLTQNLGVNIYYSVAKKIVQTLSHNNEIIIVGERDASKTFNTDDLLKPRSKHEDDIYHSMLAIKKNFEDMKCFDVSEITHEIDMDYKVKCMSCGVCNGCVTCTRCQNKYTPKVTKTGEKRYTCHECKSKNYKITNTNFIKGVMVCEHCQTQNIYATKFDSTKKKCPRCGSKSFTATRKIPVYKMRITRQKRFMI